MGLAGQTRLIVDRESGYCVFKSRERLLYRGAVSIVIHKVYNNSCDHLASLSFSVVIYFRVQLP